MPLTNAARTRIVQTRLQFSPLPSSSPAKDKYSDAVQDRLAHMRHSGTSMKQRPDTKQESLPTPEPSSQLAPDPRERTSSPLSDPPSSPNDPLSTDDEEEIQSPSTKRRISRLHNAELIEDITPSRRSSRLQTRPAIPRDSSPSSDSFIDVENSSPKPASELGSAETSGDEDDVIATKPIPGRRKPSKAINDEFVVNDDRVEYISSDEEPPTPSPAKRKRPINDNFLVDDGIVEYITSDDEPAPPPKSQKSSRRQKSPRTPRQRSRKIQEELEDDLEDLRDSDSATRKSRTRGGPVTTQRDKARAHLELLRRRRAGEKVPRVLDSDEEQDEPDGVELDFIGRPADDISDQGSIHSSVDTDPEESENGLEAEDDFVEEDSPGGRRLPHPDIPLEYTSYASAKPKELFVHIIEWLVKNRIAPAFSRNDPLWRLSFGKVNDQVLAQAGSRLISAAWNAEFKHAVLARPGIKVVNMPGFHDEDDFHTCDACNKTNHPALYDFVFSGQPYNKDTLEPIENDSDNENGDESDNVSHDDKGHSLASANRHFYLGRFCAANAEMGHKLTHWKFHLNENLLAYLEEQGVLSAEAIIAREKLNKKKREKEAEAIVDQMQETRMIAQLWADFQNDLEDARLGMEGYEKKGGRSRHRVGAVRSARDSAGVVREWREEQGGQQSQRAIVVDSDSE